MQGISDITKSIDNATVKKIFGNKNNAIGYLVALSGDQHKKAFFKRYKSDALYLEIAKTWNYKKALLLIRNIFTTTTKYGNGKEGNEAIGALLEEWQKLGFGKVEWPFSQGAFDAFVQSINSEALDRKSKDDKIKIAAVKYRRIKEINTVRNDFLETLIFEKNTNIIPTLSHSRGVDFFINGISYDQKVAKSPTAEFKKDFGDNWRDEALKNPTKVAEYLYSLQDEGRFGAEPRLFIVYLDEDIAPSRVEEIIAKSDLKNPLKVAFEFEHAKTGRQTYKTFCFVVLLYN